MWDNGGVALSTAAQVTVTAKVQESLTFCVYLSSCGDAPAVALGNANGVLVSTTTNYTATSKFDLGSNAANGVVVRLKGDTLKTGAFSITSIGATCTADLTTATLEQFGLRVSTAGTGVTATAPYLCGSGNHALDVATACSTGEENVTCTYGDLFASTAGGNAATTPTTVEYMAKASTTTEAGIYTANFGYIATGKY
jgi:hypothetical protein